MRNQKHGYHLLRETSTFLPYLFDGEWRVELRPSSQPKAPRRVDVRALQQQVHHLSHAQGWVVVGTLSLEGQWQ